MDMVPRRKIVNQIDYATDYSDEYNMLIQWKSAQRPITGTWKLFGENQFFKELKKTSKNYHDNKFQNATKIISAKQLLSFSLITKSKSYVEGLLDCFSLIADELYRKSDKYIRSSITQRNIERNEYRNLYHSYLSNYNDHYY